MLMNSIGISLEPLTKIDELSIPTLDVSSSRTKSFELSSCFSTTTVVLNSVCWNKGSSGHKDFAYRDVIVISISL